jgi:hypothetical protein
VVDGGEEGAVADVAEGAEEEFDLGAGEEVRQRFFADDLDLFPDVPAEFEVAVVEVAQAGDGLVDGAALELAIGLEVDQEVEDLVGLEFRGFLIGVVAGDLTCPVEVDLGRARGETCELDIALELDVPWLGCDGGGLRRYFVVCIVFFFISLRVWTNALSTSILKVRSAAQRLRSTRRWTGTASSGMLQIVRDVRNINHASGRRCPSVRQL